MCAKSAMQEKACTTMSETMNTDHVYSRRGDACEKALPVEPCPLLL
jgi:hypothetical protein